MRTFACSLILVSSLVINLSTHAANVVIHDAAGPFLNFWQNSSGLAESDILTRFKSDVVPKASAVYLKNFQYWKEVERVDPERRIKEQLASFPAIQSRFVKLYRQISPSLNTFLEEFQNTFSDLDETRVDIYILHSLGQSNGAAIPDGDRILFYLGIDMMAIHNTYERQKPFFDHEFFHVYHLQKYKFSAKLYSQLWMEGLAVFVAEKLNPLATHAELMIDENLIHDTLAAKSRLLADLDKKLEIADAKENFKYFNVASVDDSVPKRAGYYIGYLLVKDIATRKSLTEMIHLQESQILREMHQSIRNLQQ